MPITINRAFAFPGGKIDEVKELKPILLNPVESLVRKFSEYSALSKFYYNVSTLIILYAYYYYYFHVRTIRKYGRGTTIILIGSTISFLSVDQKFTTLMSYSLRHYDRFV